MDHLHGFGERCPSCAPRYTIESQHDEPVQYKSRMSKEAAEARLRQMAIYKARAASSASLEGSSGSSEQCAKAAEDITHKRPLDRQDVVRIHQALYRLSGADDARNVGTRDQNVTVTPLSVGQSITAATAGDAAGPIYTASLSIDFVHAAEELSNLVPILEDLQHTEVRAQPEDFGEHEQIQCRHCDRICTSRKALLNHSRNRHGTLEARTRFREQNPYQCNECDLGFRSQRSLTLHDSMMHNVDVTVRARKELYAFSCVDCPERFETSRGLLIHKARSHPRDANPLAVYSCTVCGRVFENFDQWEFHKKRAHILRTAETHPFGCTVPGCSSRFERQQNLDFHYDHKHATRPDKWQCGLCGHRFTSRNLMIGHTKSVHGRAFRDWAEEELSDDSGGDEDDQNPSFISYIQGEGAMNDERSWEKVSLRDSRSLRPLRKGYSTAKFHDGQRLFGTEESRRPSISYRELVASGRPRKKLLYCPKFTVLEDPDEIEGLNAHLRLIDLAFPDEEPQSYFYVQGEGLPFPNFVGMMTVPIWGSTGLAVSVQDASLSIVTGGSIFVFEVPRDFFYSIIGRAEQLMSRTPGNTWSAVRYGSTVGLISETASQPKLRGDLVEGRDFQGGFGNFEEARRFLLADVQLGTIHNDMAHVALSRAFLW